MSPHGAWTGCPAPAPTTPGGAPAVPSMPRATQHGASHSFQPEVEMNRGTTPRRRVSVEESPNGHVVQQATPVQIQQYPARNSTAAQPQQQLKQQVPLQLQQMRHTQQQPQQTQQHRRSNQL